MATEELKVKISADASGFKSAMSSISSEMKNVTSNTKQFAQSVGKGLQSTGKIMTGVGVGIVASIGGIVAKGAEWSAQVEGQKFLYNNLDKSIQKSIDSNSKNAKSIGLTAQQYKDGATTISTYYKNMGMTAKETAKLSGETMNLVADLGAVVDMPFDEAMSRFKSGLMGNYEALDAFGINLSANTLQNSEFVKSLGKSWNQLSDNEKMMAAYNEILRQSAPMQGLAGQEAESFGMKFKLLKEQISETVGEIGTKLLPVLEPLIAKISEVTLGIADWVAKNPELTQAILVVVGLIGTFMAVVGPLIMVIGTLILAVTAFDVAMLPVIGTIMLVIGAIALLITAGVWLCQNWETVKQASQNTWNFICDTITSIIDTIVQWTVNSWNAVSQWTINTWNSISSFLSGVWNGIKGTCTSVFDSVKNFIKGAWDGVKSTTSSIWNAIKSALSSTWNNIKSIATSTFNSLKSSVSSIWNGIKSTATSIWDSIKTAISNPINKAKEAVSNAVQAMKRVLDVVLPSPKLKMPHVKITGGFSIMPPSVPKFSVVWKSKGAIFKRPTVLGGVGVGDKHNGMGSNAEAVLPIDKLPELLGLDKKDDAVGGYDLPIILNIDGREFMRAVAPYREELDSTILRNPRFSY